MPEANPPAPPVLRASSATWTDGNCLRTAAAVSSGEALSTTITASAGRVCAAVAASASSSSSRRL
jgi:hypothetical protein